jgi:hypothetical protein
MFFAGVIRHKTNRLSSSAIRGLILYESCRLSFDMNRDQLQTQRGLALIIDMLIRRRLFFDKIKKLQSNPARHGPEKFLAREGDRHTSDFVNDQTLGIFVVIAAGGICHEEFISRAHGGVAPDTAGFEFPHAAIDKHGRSLINTTRVFHFSVDEKVDFYRMASIPWRPGRSAITGLGRGPEAW